MSTQPTNREDGRLGSDNQLTEPSREQPTIHQLGEANQETSQQYTVQEAAEILGISVDAVRGRIRRGTLTSLKADGVVYVLLDSTNREQQSDKSPTNDGDRHQQTADQSELVTDLRGQIDWLRREVERKDMILMQMAQRIPELEAAPETRDAYENTDETRPGTETPHSDAGQPRRSWWRRFFGFE